MKKLISRFAALLLCVVMAALLLCSAAAAEEAEGSCLGKPFPDFTVTDSDGNTFTLSEALKDHEAVVINFWATWCMPCRNEFPFLTEIYEQYGDKVAFIALSTGVDDTLEDVAAYRTEVGIPFPMGLDEERKLSDYVNSVYLPTTVIVDRFGIAAFVQEGVFTMVNDVRKLVEAFLGDGYTETAVLDQIPRDTATQAFPVSAARAIYPEDENSRKILISVSGYDKPFTGYIVPAESVRLRIEIDADDDAAAMTYQDMILNKALEIQELLDPEHGVFVYDQSIPGPSEEYPYSRGLLFDRYVENGDDPKEISVFLARDEESANQLVKDIREAEGAEEVTWAYAEEEEKPEGSSLQAYIVHVVDQDNNPVAEVIVNFCTDTACVPSESDEDGTITFTGVPAVYHVQIVDVPEGYSWDEDYEMYTSREYGEWVLRVKKD